MKIAMSVILLSLSFSAFSKTFTCEVIPLHADIGGYVMPGKTIFLKTDVQDQIAVEKCAKFVNSSRDLVLCATPTHFDGGYEVIVLDPKSNDMSNALFGTRKNQLVNIINIFDILGSVKTKLNNAEIAFPSSYDGGDSLQIDDMVEAGMKNKVLKHNEVIIYEINSCKMI